MERLLGKLEIHSKPHILRMRLSIWQDSQDKRSGRSITCFVRKWKEKVAWPRLTKDDIKVGVWGNGLLFLLCCLCTCGHKSGNHPWLLSHQHSITHKVLFDFLNMLESVTSSFPNSGLIHHWVRFIAYFQPHSQAILRMAPSMVCLKHTFDPVTFLPKKWLLPR